MTSGKCSGGRNVKKTKIQLRLLSPGKALLVRQPLEPATSQEPVFQCRRRRGGSPCSGF